MGRVLAACAVVLLLASAASAATIRGSSRGDRLVGTPRADLLYGLGGNDTVHALEGGDFVDPGAGRDVVRGGGGADLVSVETDGTSDRVLCGDGRDIVTADELDARAGDCEVLTRRLSRDPFRAGPGQHATHAEPDSFAWGNTIVTVFQVGRVTDGGAMDIGFATSTDGGARWRAGRLPGVAVSSAPTGTAARVSDPVIAYDAAHGVWLAATLAITPGLTELLVSRSPDGLAWSLPVVVASSTAPSLAYDKEWIACDSWPGSPRRGTCYLAYTDLEGAGLATRASVDGGLTWSTPAHVPPPQPSMEGQFVSGAQPVARPDGTLLLVFIDNLGIAAARSFDGGRTFAPVARVSDRRPHPVTGMRAPALPSVDVAADGTIFVVWHDCRFRPGCRANDVVVSTSGDGVRWQTPRRLPLAAETGSADRFLPAVAVQQAGSLFRVSVVYYSMPTTVCLETTCRVDVGYAESADGGVTWTAPRRLNARSMRLTWIAQSNQGHMLADYISVSFVAGRPVPVFTLASPPVGGSFRQATFATTSLR